MAGDGVAMAGDGWRAQPSPAKCPLKKEIGVVKFCIAQDLFCFGDFFGEKRLVGRKGALFGGHRRRKPLF